MKHIFLVSLLFTSALGKFRLADISIANGIVPLTVENGAKLYVSSNDDAELLKKIKITNKFDTKTAYELSQLGSNLDGTKTEWLVSGDVTISSTNTKADAEGLNGFVYFTTFTQAQDKSFLVYSVDQNKVISYDNDDLTLVFLNQNLNQNQNNGNELYVPDKSSQVYDFTSSSKSSILIYWDEPSETYKNPKSDDSQRHIIFSNPILLKDWQYFDTVEPFNIFNDIWYLRAKGQFRFQVRPKWEDPNGMTTSKVTSTGMVMCSYAPENLTINMLSNPANAAVSGFMVLYNVINPITFSMSGVSTTVNIENRTTNNIRGAYGDSMTTFFKIESDEEIAGHFAAQYFQIEGAPLPSTAPGTTGPTTTSAPATTATVPTTTKSTSTIFNILIISVVIVQYF